MNRVEVTIVAMLTEVKGRGGNRLALQWPPRAGFGRRTREGREGEEIGSSSAERSREWEGEEEEGERGSRVVVTKIFYGDDESLRSFKKKLK